MPRTYDGFDASEDPDATELVIDGERDGLTGGTGVLVAEGGRDTGGRATIRVSSLSSFSSSSSSSSRFIAGLSAIA
jgi:hypothetical protein